MIVVSNYLGFAIIFDDEKDIQYLKDTLDLMGADDRVAMFITKDKVSDEQVSSLRTCIRAAADAYHVAEKINFSSEG